MTVSVVDERARPRSRPGRGVLTQGTWVKLVRLAADLGDEEAERRLARWLDRMRERAAAGDEIARQILSEWPD